MEYDIVSPRCDLCGKFIAYEDFSIGAVHKCISLASYYEEEEF